MSLKIQSSLVSTSRLKLWQKQLLQTAEGSCGKVLNGLFERKRKTATGRQTIKCQSCNVTSQIQLIPERDEGFSSTALPRAPPCGWFGRYAQSGSSLDMFMQNSDLRWKRIKYLFKQKKTYIAYILSFCFCFVFVCRVFFLFQWFQSDSQVRDKAKKVKEKPKLIHSHK